MGTGSVVNSVRKDHFVSPAETDSLIETLEQLSGRSKSRAVISACRDIYFSVADLLHDAAILPQKGSSERDTRANYLSMGSWDYSRLYRAYLDFSEWVRGEKSILRRSDKVPQLPTPSGDLRAAPLAFTYTAGKRAVFVDATSFESTVSIGLDERTTPDQALDRLAFDLVEQGFPIFAFNNEPQTIIRRVLLIGPGGIPHQVDPKALISVMTPASPELPTIRSTLRVLDLDQPLPPGSYQIEIVHDFVNGVRMVNGEKEVLVEMSDTKNDYYLRRYFLSTGLYDFVQRTIHFDITGKNANKYCLQTNGEIIESGSSGSDDKKRITAQLPATPENGPFLHLIQTDHYSFASKNVQETDPDGNRVTIPVTIYADTAELAQKGLESSEHELTILIPKYGTKQIKKVLGYVFDPVVHPKWSSMEHHQSFITTLEFLSHELRHLIMGRGAFLDSEARSGAVDEGCNTFEENREIKAGDLKTILGETAQTLPNDPELKKRIFASQLPSFSFPLPYIDHQPHREIYEGFAAFLARLNDAYFNNQITPVVVQFFDRYANQTYSMEDFRALLLVNLPLVKQNRRDRAAFLNYFDSVVYGTRTAIEIGQWEEKDGSISIENALGLFTWGESDCFSTYPYCDVPQDFRGEFIVQVKGLENLNTGYQATAGVDVRWGAVPNGDITTSGAANVYLVLRAPLTKTGVPTGLHVPALYRRSATRTDKFYGFTSGDGNHHRDPTKKHWLRVVFELDTNGERVLRGYHAETDTASRPSVSDWKKGWTQFQSTPPISLDDIRPGGNPALQVFLGVNSGQLNNPVKEIEFTSFQWVPYSSDIPRPKVMDETK